jgi:hypothetical protein
MNFSRIGRSPAPSSASTEHQGHDRPRPGRRPRRSARLEDQACRSDRFMESPCDPWPECRSAPGGSSGKSTFARSARIHANGPGHRWQVARAGETMPCALASASASASRVRLPCACRAFHAKRCPDRCAHPRMELINMNPSQAHRRPGTRRRSAAALALTLVVLVTGCSGLALRHTR